MEKSKNLSIVQEEKIKPHLLDFSLEEWEKWCTSHKYPKFVAKQIYSWIFEKEVVDPLLFSNLSEEKRKRIADEFSTCSMKIESRLLSKDLSEKLLLMTHDRLLIEMVIMPYENRVTLCLSCQVGCRMGCTFCQTGRMGLKRNLSSGEILYQIVLANQLLKEKELKVTNVVFMGMGEPLDNYVEVVKACKVMIDPNGFNLSKNKVTISTSGLVPMIEKLGQDLPVRLAISLHSAEEEKRSKMMPINRKHPLSELKKTLMVYPASPRYGITFEYVLIQNENDSIQDAKKLVHFLHGIKAKVNLIPINKFPGVDMDPSDEERIKAFQSYLTDRGIPAPVRYSKGQDVSGGCGQLAAKKEEELDMDPRVLFRQRRKETS